MLTRAGQSPVQQGRLYAHGTAAQPSPIPPQEPTPSGTPPDFGSWGGLVDGNRYQYSPGYYIRLQGFGSTRPSRARGDRRATRWPRSGLGSWSPS